MKILTEESVREYKEKITDPWPRMAIDEQFRPLVKGSPFEPATLHYIEEHMHDEDWEYYEDTFESIWSELHHLTLKGGYAQALVNLLGSVYEGDDYEPLTVESAMDMVLSEPEELMRCIIEFVESPE